MSRSTAQKEARRTLRQTATKPEQLLWAVLRNRRLDGLKFRRQYSVGRYVADFACVQHRLLIELDGGYHDLVGDRDVARQAFLEAQGFRVIRFTNDDVLTDIDAVAESVRRVIGNATLIPTQNQAATSRSFSPGGGEGGRRPDEGDSSNSTAENKVGSQR